MRGGPGLGFSGRLECRQRGDSEGLVPFAASAECPGVLDRLPGPMVVGMHLLEEVQDLFGGFRRVPRHGPEVLHRQLDLELAHRGIFARGRIRVPLRCASGDRREGAQC